jgi:hypothetical protein
VVRELVRRKIDAQDGLRLTKVLFNRHPFIPKSVDTDALGRCYSRLRDHLIARLPAVDKVRSRLALFATHCHFHSGNYPAAIEAAQRATTVEDRIHAAFDIARSHCFSGDLDQTLVSLDRLVELMCQHGPIHAPQPAAQVRAADEPEPDKEARNTFDPVQASQALLDLQNALAPIGKKAFLVSGTLLGFHREGGCWRTTRTSMWASSAGKTSTRWPTRCCKAVASDWTRGACAGARPTTSRCATSRPA